MLNLICVLLLSSFFFFFFSAPIFFSFFFFFSSRRRHTRSLRDWSSDVCSSDLSYSPNIALGLVFLGQFVDHDLTLNNSEGDGPSSDPNHPVNLRTPALDLDRKSVV